jgi:hypothetical protein
MVTTYVARTRALPVFLGKCGSCVRPVRAEDEAETRDHVSRPCPDCGQAVKVERLYGTVSEMSCNALCEGAGGPSCDCACGGVNHGGVWSKPGHMLAGELAAYRAGVAKREAERQARREAERDRKRRAFDRWRAGNEPVVTELLAVDWLEGRYPNGFLADLACLLRRHEVLTGPQAEAARRILAKRHAAAEEAQSRAATAVDVPEGRHTVTGTVVGKYWRDNPFSPYATQTLCIVVDTGTYRVRGTCPDALMVHRAADGTFGGGDGIAKGDRVTFSATLQPDGKEKGSGYFKRPTKPAFVTA